MSKKQIFVALLTLLICAPSYAGVALDDTTNASQGRNANGNGLTAEMVRRELELFRTAEVSLRQALKIADGLHIGSRIVDISFDGGSGSPVYRVKTFKEDHIWEDAIDAKTGRVAGDTTVSSMNDLDLEDRINLIGLQSVRQELADAVLVAENNTSGKAISGGLMNEAGKVNFVIVVLSGTNLKQVILEPPTANNLQALPHRSRQR
ncbi:MAG: PepSY domain-containing protein [Terriglobales bacterium]